MLNQAVTLYIVDINETVYFPRNFKLQDHLQYYQMLFVPLHLPGHWSLGVSKLLIMQDLKSNIVL